MAKKVYVGVDNPIKLTDAHQYSIDEMISAGYATTDSTWVACSGIADYGVYYDNSIPCILATPLDNGDGDLYIYSTDYLRTGIGYYVRVDKWALGTLPSPGGGNYALEAWFVQGGVATRYYPGVSGFARIVKKIYLGVEGYKEVEGYLSPWTEYGLSSTQTVYRIANPTHSINSPYYDVRTLSGTYTLQSLNDYAMEEGASQEFVTSPPNEGNITEYYYLPGMSNNAVLKRSLIPTSIAHKVKKAYIGVGGVARPCFGHDPIEYYGTVTPLRTARWFVKGSTVGNYAVFAGDYTSKMVDAYNTSLIRITATDLSDVKYYHAAATVGDYALFAGGVNGNRTNSLVNAYNKSLNRSTPTSLTFTPLKSCGVTIKNHALFAGGSSESYYSTVNAYSTSLTRSTPTSLSVARDGAAGVTIGNYALVGGGLGRNTDDKKVVDAYNSSLVRTIPTALPEGCSDFGAASAGTYAIFVGSWKAFAYNTSLVQTTPSYPSNLPQSATLGATLGDYAIFRYKTQTFVCNSNLIWKRLADVPSSIVTSLYTGVTTIGKYVLCAGGGSSKSTATDVVDAYVYYPNA